MSKFKKMLEKTVAASQETMQVTKMPETNAPKKDNVVEKSLPKTKEVAEILDMMYILKSAKQSVGQDLNAKDLAMFSAELHEKAATQIADVAAVIPSGFSGRFIQDMYAMTGLEGLDLLIV